MPVSAASEPHDLDSGPSALAALQLSEPELQHVMVQALPPQTDYLTYLTVLEYNVDRQSTPLLGKLLAGDQRLVTNIGWDLVQLLLPLLPESKPCLDLVAQRGNPREVIIKVTEALELLAQHLRQHERSSSPSAFSANSKSSGSNGGGGSDAESLDENYSDPHRPSTADLDNINTNSNASGNEAHNSSAGETENLPVKLDNEAAQQFVQLLRMLSVLHLRIETKRPSRFLSTTVESVLVAYKALEWQAVLGLATDAVIDLLHDLSSLTKPPLPPRGSNLVSTAVTDLQLAPFADPEAEPVDHGEKLVQLHILIAFATHVLDIFSVQLRLAFPPDKISLTSKYMVNYVYERMPTSSQGDVAPLMLAQINDHWTRFFKVVGSDLGMRGTKLRELLPNSLHERRSQLSPDSLAASLRGSLCFLALSELKRVEVADGRSQFNTTDHVKLVDFFLGQSEEFDLGPATLTVIDAILFLGLVWITKDAPFNLPASVTDGDQHVSDTSHRRPQGFYNRYLQNLSFVSANAPSPILRYQMHYLVTRIIRHTEPLDLRLGYIQDTLDFCPYENLRTTAVGWYKDEVVAAFASSRLSLNVDDPFRRSETLRMVGSSIFAAPNSDMVADLADKRPDTDELTVSLPTWLAALNLIYLLCANPKIREALEVAAVFQTLRVNANFLQPLQSLSLELLGRTATAGSDSTPEREAYLHDGQLLSDAAGQAQSGLAMLGLG